ncbi:MAG: FAD-binding oxidoreductase [SAR324 cluster bacterium]|nr:FAD-binding oxidoreductase [SAR324 cluster bacterium]
MYDTDIIVVGAGIAGASAAHELSDNFKVLILEMETHAGYHTSGRSAAIYTKIYSSEACNKLANLSLGFLQSPPDEFCDFPLLKERGILHVARSDQIELLKEEKRKIESAGDSAEKVEGNDLFKLVPALESGNVTAGLYDSNTWDIDVNELHGGFLRSVKKKGGILLTETKVLDLKPLENGWLVKTNQGEYSCQTLVNAAGAWSDELAALAGCRKLGLIPKKRNAFLFNSSPEVYETEEWPFTVDISEQFYFKPDSGKLLASPADESPAIPHDARPDDLGIAMGVERLEGATSLKIRHISHKWAGLRSFFPDSVPVVGFDPNVEHFFWLAGQGGIGMLTSPAMAACCASLIREGELPGRMIEAGLSKEDLSPCRF